MEIFHSFLLEFFFCPSLIQFLSLQTIAATLYDEGAIIVIYAVLVNCRFMLERSSNNYGELI